MIVFRRTNSLVKPFLQGVVILISVLVVQFTSTSVYAFSPTAEQVEMFQNLSASEKEALMGKVSAGGSSGNAPANVPVVEMPTITPVISAPDKIVEKTVVAVVNDNKESLMPYGSFLFAGNPTTFAPVNNIPAPTDYILGPGDQLKIQTFGTKNDSYQLVIDRNGQVVLPSIGPVNIAGISFSEANALLLKKLETLGVGVNSVVTLGDLRSFRIFVLGESRTPGSYLVSGMATITHALYVSGGISEVGSYRNVQLKRNGRLVKALDLYDLLLKGDTSNDVRLQPGDTVFIPKLTKQVAISGEVFTPAIYELKNEQNLQEVLALAGGLRPQAYLKGIKLSTVVNSDYRDTLDVDFTSPEGRIKKLKNGDQIIVPTIRTSENDMVTLSGPVHRESQVQWTAGLRLLDLIPSRELFTNSADVTSILIKRQAEVAGPYEVLATNWLKAIQAPSSVFNTFLQPRDKVVVLTNAGNIPRRAQLDSLLTELKQQTSLYETFPSVSMSGALEFTGEYPLLKSMRLLDLLPSRTVFENDADLNSIIIERQPMIAGNYLYLTVDWEQAFSQPNSADNVILQARDKVIVLNKQSAPIRMQQLQMVKQRLQEQADIQTPLKLVTSAGMVKFKGDYPLIGGMKVSGLIKLSGGLNASAMVNEAEIFRYEVVGGEKREVERIVFNLAKALAGDPQHDVELQANDLLTIKQVSDWSDATRSVTLKGEVAFPGKYVLKPGETLESLLVRAGGFTQWAAPENAVFLRADLRLQEKREMDALADELEKNLIMAIKSDAGLLEKDTGATLATMGQSLIAKIKQTPALGRLVIGLKNDNSRRYRATMDLELRDGDTLVVPKRSSEVVIIGEVSRPASLLYQSDLSIEDYVEMSGGFTKRSDKGSIYVVHGDGSIQKYSTGFFGGESDLVLKPGDTIVVPLDVERMNYLVTWTAVSKVLANFAVTAATLKTVGVIN